MITFWTENPRTQMQGCITVAKDYLGTISSFHSAEFTYGSGYYYELEIDYSGDRESESDWD